MATTLGAEEEEFEGAELGGFELPPDFRMPTTEEIEWDLALGNPGWRGLLRAPQDQPALLVPWFRRVATKRLAAALVLLTVATLGALFVGAKAMAIGSAQRTVAAQSQ